MGIRMPACLTGSPRWRMPSRMPRLWFGGMTYTQFASTGVPSWTCATLIGVYWARSSASRLSWVGARCWMTTKAAPLSAGSAAKKLLKASRAPADPPIPTTGMPDAPPADSPRASSTTEADLRNARLPSGESGGVGCSGFLGWPVICRPRVDAAEPPSMRRSRAATQPASGRADAERAVRGLFTASSAKVNLVPVLRRSGTRRRGARPSAWTHRWRGTWRACNRTCPRTSTRRAQCPRPAAP